MAYIKAITYYLPSQVETNEDLLKDFPEWSIEKVEAKVGVKARHLAAPDETAGDMAEQAARRLFAAYDIDPQSIDFVLLCTESPDHLLPSTACILQHRLGIPTSAGALDYTLGCSGFCYGLALAKGLIAGGVASNILLLTADTFRRFIHPADRSNRSIFGEGAAACLISTEGMAEIGDFVLGTDGGGAEHLIVRTGGARCRQATGHETEDEEGHRRYDDYFYMNGSAVFNFTLEVVPQLISDILKKHSMRQDEVDQYVFHQANKFMLNTIRKVCALPKDKFYVNLEETGNTVSSSIPIALCDCLDHGTITPGMRVMVAGFGVGLSWSGTILKF